jgi:cytochrome oxidase Cu insertion factor (SCO1/SenC/PrrC family)
MKILIMWCRRIRLMGCSSFLAAVALLLVADKDLAPAAAPTRGPVDGEGLTPTDLERLKVGDPAPDFTLEDENGTPVTLSQFREKQTVILVFYRGHW